MSEKIGFGGQRRMGVRTSVVVLFVMALAACFQPAGPTDGDGVETEPDIETGLLGYYPFSGNANDASGHGSDDQRPSRIRPVGANPRYECAYPRADQGSR